MRKQRSELNSWKEIAERLDVSVRTAQMWEKERGLPVQRPPGDRGARVYALEEDIERWLRGSEAELSVPGAPAPLQRSRLGRRAAALGLLVAFSLVAAYAVLSGGSEGGVVGWRVTPERFVALRADDSIAWESRFETPLREDLYRGHHAAQIVDLDGDGSNEVLFPYVPADRMATQSLLCFSAEGALLWQFDLDEEIQTSAEAFPGPYHLARFTVGLSYREDRGILLSSHHNLEFPSRIVLLDAAGVIRADYWHPGRLGVRDEQLLLADLDGDGQGEIYAAGINNARDQATLVVLDPGTFGAGYEEAAEYHFAGVARASERARILFPQSSIGAERSVYNEAIDLRLKQGQLTVGVEESPGAGPLGMVFYEFSGTLNLEGVWLSDTFRSALIQRSAGRSAGEGTEIRRLRDGVAIERPVAQGAVPSG